MKKTYPSLLLLLLASPSWALAQGKYDVCVNYYSRGDVSCATAPSATQLMPTQQTDVAPRLLDPPAPAQTHMDAEVDKYLENYGKPPREFVEFYLNPTQENAMKWVATYQQMLKRGQALSQSWNQADELYRQSGADISTSISQLPPVPGVALPATFPVIAAPNGVPQVSGPVNSPPATPLPPSIGAFANTSVGPSSEIGGIPTPVNLNYYFSATCPYCEKMTPQLNEIQKQMQSELKLTCIDVTPFGKTVRADPANIASKLSCQWRMPEEGEVEKMGVQQTPTLFIQRGDAAPVRLSGYVPLEQLRAYISGRAKP